MAGHAVTPESTNSCSIFCFCSYNMLFLTYNIVTIVPNVIYCKIIIAGFKKDNENEESGIKKMKANTILGFHNLSMGGPKKKRL